LEMFRDRLFLLALNRAAFLRPRERFFLARKWRGVTDLERSGVATVRQLLGRGVREQTWRPEEWISSAREDLAAIEDGRLKAWFVGQRGYPRILELKLGDPPVVLYWKGTCPAWGAAMVGVVGTRRPTGRARKAAVELGQGLAELGVQVVSGLARGIDRNTHQGVVQGVFGSVRRSVRRSVHGSDRSILRWDGSGPGVGGAPSAGLDTGLGAAIAVLGSGIDRIYPNSNRVLARRILQNDGCILSEFPPGVGVFRHHFPARNRIISGLSQTLVVVQAPAKSGALITADYALEQGTDLVVHREGLRGPEGEGTRELVESGAPIIQGVGDLFPVARNRDGVQAPEGALV
jgi:DNA processing protein